MKKRRRYIAWVFLTPSLILYLYFFVYPTINGLRISLYNWSGFTVKMEYVGFKNFSKLIVDEVFLSSLKNTLILLIIGGLAIFLIAFVLSLILNSGIRGKKVYRSIIFFPFIIGQIVHAIYWGLLVYSPKNGILNRFFELLHIAPLAKFTFLNYQHIFGSVLFVIIWINVGFYLVLLLAGIDRIPPYLYEAARIEGANEFQLFFKITLPLVKEVLTIAMILWVIFAIKMFDILYAFGGLWPPREIWTNAIYMYVMGFGKMTPIFELGYASAMGVIALFLVVIFAIIIRKSIRREVYEY